MNIVDASGNPLGSGSDTVSVVPVESVGNSIKPREMRTGSTRGTQTVGYGSVKLDGSNNRILIDNPGDDGGVKIGDFSDTATDTTFGFSVADTTGTERLRGGTFSDGNIKIKLSQPGYDVASAADDQLIWSSDFNSFKIVQSGTVNITVPSGSFYEQYTSTVLHGLGYIPIPLVLVTPPTGSGLTLQALPYYIYTFVLGTATVPVLNMQTTASVNSTSVIIDLIAKTSIAVFTGDWTFKYYLLRETAN